MSYTKEDTSPLGIFLVKSDSKGEKLLFRYPYCVDDSNECVNKSKSKYAIVVNEDSKTDESQNTQLQKAQTATSLPSYTELTSTTLSKNLTKTASNESVATFIGISDSILSSLFAVNKRLCSKKFQLKIDNVRFVSHPMLIDDTGSNNVRKKSNYITFNIVFALRANADHDIVESYLNLSEKLAIALRTEENRCSYFSEETRVMLRAHDESSALPDDPEGALYKFVLEKCRLAQDLKKVYEDVSIKGQLQIRINRWIEVSFCLPQKVHRLMLKTQQFSPSISWKNINNCLQTLRPYHAILLLVDKNEIINCLPLDALPDFKRVIQFAKPSISLSALSADADISMSVLFHIVSQLIGYGKATVIYPLCETNTYMIHPLANTNNNSILVEEFEEKFPGIETLLKLLSKFSFSVTLSQLISPMDSPEQRSKQIAAVEWMLKHRLLLQLHTYVFLLPLSQSSPYITQRIFQLQSDRPHSSLTTTEVDGIEFSTGSSYPSEDSLATSPANATSLMHSSKSTSEDDLSSPKINSTPSMESCTELLRDVGLCPSEVEAILKSPGSKNLEDLKLFAKLCPYFNGRSHLEQIMYYGNVRRGLLLSIIDKFRDVLSICQYEDTCVSQLYPYKNHDF